MYNWTGEDRAAAVEDFWRKVRAPQDRKLRDERGPVRVWKIQKDRSCALGVRVRREKACEPTVPF